MIRILFLYIFFIVNQASYAQIPDSIINKYNLLEKKNKANLIYSYLYKITDKKLSLLKAKELLIYFEKKKDDEGMALANMYIGNYYYAKEDYSQALINYYQILNNKKKVNDTTWILNAYINIIVTYDGSNSFSDGINVTKEALHYATQDTGEYSLSFYYTFIGSFCAQGFILPDTGIAYSQKAIALDEKNKNKRRLSFSYATLAENYIAKGEYEIGLPFLRKSLQYGIETNIEDGSLAFLYNDFAQIYLAKLMHDSTLMYAYKSLILSNKSRYTQQKLRSYEYIYKTFDQMNKTDSALKYYKLAIGLKDSSYGQAKMKAIEITKFKQELAEKENEEKQKMAHDERIQNIQFIVLAIGILTLLILFFLFSHSIIANDKLISFFGILNLLVVFEFINLLIHPLLEKITHHNPFLMLLSLVILASILIPLHHKLEKWVKEKMVEKNKIIRLKQAKKTIEELETKSNL